MRRTPPPIAVVLMLLAACGARRPQPPDRAEPELVAIDIFGTQQITLEDVLATCGDELRAFGEALMKDEAGGEMEAILAKVAALGDFADVSPALVGYYQPGGMKYYLTLDFVDAADAARRMPFRSAPTRTHQDPAGLLADWQAYEAKVHELSGSGKMKTVRVDCPAFHCFGDHTHPDVAALAETFAARVPAHVEELAAILRDDRDELHRAAAADLLAYSDDGPALVQAMVLAFRDASPLVRNNAMRVVSDVAFYHPEVEIPLEPVLEALDYPATSDRNKAAAILDGLLARPGAAALQRPIVERAGATLLAMLRLRQPNNHNFAYRILKAISGRDLGEHDHAAWEAWLRSCAPARGGAPREDRAG